MNSDIAKMIAEVGNKLDSERTAQKAELPQGQHTPTNGNTDMTATEIRKVIAQSLPGQKIELIFKPDYKIKGVSSLVVDVQHCVLSWATESEALGNQLQRGLIHPRDAQTTFVVVTPKTWLSFQTVFLKHVVESLKSARVLSE